MASRLAILIETLYKGAGAQKAAKDMGALGKATQKSSMLQAVHKARTADLSKVMGQLANDVSKGTISVGQATKDFEAYKKSLPVLEVEETTKKTMGMKEAFGKMALAVGAAGAALVLAKKAFDLGAEGAKIKQLGESFDRMNESVWKTPNLLKDMQEATRNTVSETQLMSGILTLSAGATDTLASKLAEAAPRLAEIAKAANKLNPTLGDTGFMFESIATGVKRASPMILDNLGIMVKIGPANERYAASIGKAVEELTAEEKQLALLNEVMESGGRLIKQVGGDVGAAGDAYQATAAEVANLKDELVMLVNDAIGPAVNAAASHLVTMRKQGDAADEGQEAARKLGRAWGVSNREASNLWVAVTKLTAAENDGNYTAETYDEANKILAAGLKLVRNNADLTEKELIEQATAMVRAEKAAGNLEAANESLAKGYAAMAEAEGRVAVEAAFVLETTRSLSGAYDKHIGISGAITGAFDDQTHAAENTAWAMVNYGGTLKEIAIAAENAAKEHDELNAAGLATRRAFGSSTLSALDAVVAAEEAGEEATTDWTDMLFRQVAAAGDDKFAIMALGLATGNYTRAQIEAAINTVIMTNRIAELAIEIEAGTITTEQGLDALEAYGDGGVTEFERVLNEARNLNTALDDLDRDIVIKIRTEMSAPGPTTGGAGVSGTTGEFAQHGANFIVPPGFSGDKFPVWTSSGERVIVQTKEQQKAGGGGNNITINLGGGSGGGLVDAHRIAGAVADAIGARG